MTGEPYTEPSAPHDGEVVTYGKSSTHTDGPKVESLRDAAWRLTKRRIDTEGPERAGLLPFSWLDPQVVADRAGLPVSVFDELWGPTATSDGAKLSSFEAFVIETMGTAPISPGTKDTGAALETLLDSFDELIRLGATGEAFAPDRHLDYRMSLSMSCYTVEHRDDYDDYVTGVEAILSFALYPLGRQMKQGITLRHLAAAVSAAMEGPWLMEVLGVDDPKPTIRFAITPDAEPKDWQLDAIIAWAIIEAMTEPVD